MIIEVQSSSFELISWEIVFNAVEHFSIQNEFTSGSSLSGIKYDVSRYLQAEVSLCKKFCSPTLCKHLTSVGFAVELWCQHYELQVSSKRTNNKHCSRKQYASPITLVFLL